MQKISLLQTPHTSTSMCLYDIMPPLKFGLHAQDCNLVLYNSNGVTPAGLGQQHRQRRPQLQACLTPALPVQIGQCQPCPGA